MMRVTIFFLCFPFEMRWKDLKNKMQIALELIWNFF